MIIVKRQFNKRKLRVRTNIKKLNRKLRIRLSVFRSNKYIYAQLIDDQKGATLAFASSFDKDLSSKLKDASNIDAAKEVGLKIAEKAKKLKISNVVFDKGAYKYHGRVKALADGARESKYLNF